MGIRGLKDRLVARLLTRYPALVLRWAEGRKFTAGDALGDPWADLDKPLAECRVAIVTTGGVHLRDQLSFDMKNPNGDPTFREIPDGSPRGDLTITHNYYDHRSADRDINVIFPPRPARGARRRGPDRGAGAASSGFHGPYRRPAGRSARQGDGARGNAAAHRRRGGLRTSHPRLRALQPLGRADSEGHRGGGPAHRFNQPCPRDCFAGAPAPGGFSLLAAGAPAGGA